MATSTAAQILINSLIHPFMGIANGVIPIILGAFSILVGIGFGIYLFTRYVWNKFVDYEGRKGENMSMAKGMAHMEKWGNRYWN